VSDQFVVLRWHKYLTQLRLRRMIRRQISGICEPTQLRQVEPVARFVRLEQANPDGLCSARPLH